MSVKEILKNVAKIMELNDVYEYLSDSTVSPSEDTLDEVNKLLLALNMINNVIASQYIELIDIVDVAVSDNFIPYESISDKNIIEIKSIVDSHGSRVDYDLLSNGISAQANMVRIEFSYFPSDVTIDDGIEFNLKINVFTLAQGVVSEYLFLKGDFEESYIWDTKFKNSLSSLIRPKRNITTPSRRWL